MKICDLKKFLQEGTIVSSLEGKIIVGFGIRQTDAEGEMQLKPSFFFPDYFLEKNTERYTYSQVVEMESFEFIELLESYLSTVVNQPNWINEQRQHFFSTFSHIQQLIENKILDKAVPFVFAHSNEHMSVNRLANSILSALKVTQKSPLFIYGSWNENEGILGATPEVLFKLIKSGEDFVLETVACAGTCPIDEIEGFISDEKQLWEHQLVIDGIIQSMSPYGKVTVHKLEELKLPSLCHLFTRISVKLSDTPVIDTLIKALHPTPALGASPKEAGMAWLKNYQTQIDRKRFGAPLGYFKQNGEGSFYVAIRNVQWEPGHLKIGAGCGIVGKSQFEKEWEEIKLKIASTKSVLAL